MKDQEEMSGSGKIVLLAKGDADEEVVRLAEEWVKVEAVRELEGSRAEDLILQADAEGLALVEKGRVLRGDFTRLLPRLASNNLNRELLVRASRVKGVDGPLTAVDATAGLGEDALLLAAAGFQVRLYERDPVIAALLSDALRRGAQQTRLAPVVERMKLECADSITALPRLDVQPDVVVLDPMFPQRQKSALIKKKFQLLQKLEQPCAEEKELLDAAISCGPRRIVIKRPLKGPYLAGVKPSYSLKGNTIRYDCIVKAEKPGKGLR